MLIKVMDIIIIVMINFIKVNLVVLIRGVIV